LFLNAQRPHLEPRQPIFSPSLYGPITCTAQPVWQNSADTAFLDLQLIKSHCRVSQSRDDEYFLWLQQLAADHVSKLIPGHRQIGTASFSVPVQSWWTGELRVPRPPLQSVTSITYYDSGGNLQTLSTSQYIVITPTRMPGTLQRFPLSWWPAHQSDRIYPITINWVAGYSASNASYPLPPTLRQAMLLLIGWWYLNREAALAGLVSEEIQHGVERLTEDEGWGSYA
jgi:uncharacterized phiE125 gp8 family phage protein